MNLIELLPEHEKMLILDYIKEFAPVEESHLSAPQERNIEKILSPWSGAKERLYKLFGNNLTISREVDIKINKNVLREELQRVLEEEGRLFCSQFWDWYYANRGSMDYPTCHTLEMLMSTDLLSNNTRIATYRGTNIRIPTPKGKYIDIYPNSKTIKILGKIAKEFDLQGFEEFRVAHSQVLNRKVIKGKLTLSIHPLDYMTMSDNDCSWESCMSWRNQGGFRMGTVEMMNSDNVVVAYLSASKPMHLNYLSSGDEWNNKKWRCLFIVADEFISKIKSYPYQSGEFEQLIIDWLANLSKKNLSYEYDDIIIPWNGEDSIPYKGDYYRLYLFTTYMYNDIGTATHYLKPHPSFATPDNKSKHFCYSGDPQCMWCGNFTDIDCEDLLICGNCDPHTTCRECGEILSLHSDYTYEDDDGCHYCQYCYENYVFEDDITGENHHVDQKEKLYIIPTDKIIQDTEHILNGFSYLHYVLEHIYGVDRLEITTNTLDERLPLLIDDEKIHPLNDRYWGSSRHYICIEDCSESFIEDYGIGYGDNPNWKKDFVNSYMKYLKLNASPKLYSDLKVFEERIEEYY